MRSIELRVGLNDAYGRAAARGVVRYARERKDWRIYGAGGPFPELSDLDLRQGRGADGVIARIESAEEARLLARRGVPVVDLAGAFPGAAGSAKPFLEANNDDFLTGRRAGEYLRGLGFRSFAFCGVERVLWSRRRKAGFAEACALPLRELPSFERGLDWWKDRERGRAALAEWLGRLPAPTALFACNDVAGLKASGCCAGAGRAVPEDLAILGADDEDLLCELADPPLSSVRLDCEGIGWAAAALLDEAFSGAAGTGQARCVAPREVVERESTRVLVGTDPLAARALAWIRANAPGGANASDAAAAQPLCRRALERRFKAALGKTLHEAVLEARLDKARRLLETTDLTLDAVADGSGFGALQRFHAAFKAAEGLSPGAWRGALKRPARET